MRSAPRKLSSDDQLYTAAINALARRPYSVKEMSLYLQRRAETPVAAREALARLVDHKYLDDARYARQFVHHRAEIRKQGTFRISRDLRTRGVSDAHIDAAIAERAAEFDESEIVRAKIKRRLTLLRKPLDQRITASIYGSLLRSGFSSDTIRRELKAVAKVEVNEITETSEAFDA